MVRRLAALVTTLVLYVSAVHAKGSPSWSKSLQACATSMDGKLPASTPADFKYSGKVRQYYVAAEEVEWDYAPSGWDNWLGVPLSDSPRAQSASVDKYGTKWLKALYRGYTDSSFSAKTQETPYQGTQGPTLRAEVGDMIEIMFVNKLSHNYASMHSMGLVYNKYSEGADYPNNTMPGQEMTLPTAEAVPPVDGGLSPGNCVVYKWLVSELAGPSYGQPARTHSYHSYVSMYEDTNAGLIGPSIVYAKGAMESTMAAYREIPLLYMIYDENVSFLSGNNSAVLNGTSSSASQVSNIYPGGNQSYWYPQVVNINSGQQFSSAPSFHTMNGYVFANNPVFDMCLSDQVIWYVNAYGSASHVFHMHGSSFEYDGAHKSYAVSLNDGVGRTLFMNATNVGKWQVLCHVSNHQAKGMVADYQIWPQSSCPVSTSK